MLKFITATVVVAAVLVAAQASSEGAGRRHCSGPAPVYQAVTPSAQPAQAAAPNGYRSFSYQPGNYYAPRSMSSGYRPGSFHGHSAGWKAGVGR